LGNLINSHRTEEMGDVLKYNYLEGWKEIGGGLAMHFTLASSYNRYGCWGLTDDYTNPDRNYKMQAVRDIISTYTSIEENNDSDENIIYPNPAKDFIYLNEYVRTYSISNLNGEIIQKDNNLKSPRIDISKLENGVYFLSFKNKNIKFIVSK
jgi:hypothetical protein